MNTIITDHHIEMIDSEITWKENTDVLNGVEGINDYFSTILKLSNGFRIEVCFNDFSLYELLSEKFELETGESGDKVLGKLYFNSSFNNNTIGSINTGSNIAYVEGDGFGIFKSAISGLATLWCEGNESTLPVHGSAIYSNQIGGLAMVGGHRVGKTTGLLNISNLLGEGEIVSDDWLLANFNDNNLNVTTTDNSISLSSKTVKENQHIPQISSPEILADVSKRKTSYKPGLLLGEQFVNHETPIGIDRLIVLVTGVKDAITVLTDLNNIPEFIVGATYHFPYYDLELKENHIERWKKGLEQSGVQIIAYDHTYFDSMTSGYTKLINTIIKGTV